MNTFVLIHGAGDVGWYWHLVAAELRIAGRVTAAIDELPPDAVGKQFSFAETDVFELREDGLVGRMSIYADTMTFMKQVGGGNA